MKLNLRATIKPIILYHSTFFTSGLKILREGYINSSKWGNKRIICFSSDPDYVKNPDTGVDRGLGFVFKNIQNAEPFNYREHLKNTNPENYRDYVNRPDVIEDEAEYRVEADRFEILPNLNGIILLEYNLTRAPWTYRDAIRASGLKIKVSPNYEIWKRALKQDELYVNDPKIITENEHKTLTFELIKSVYSGKVDIL